MGVASIPYDEDAWLTCAAFRHWDIIDGNGKHRQVDGEGVVGEQPTLTPDQAFKYHSFADLQTHWGTMEGYYLFTRLDEAHQPVGEPFRVAIGRFWLTPENAAEPAVS